MPKASQPSEFFVVGGPVQPDRACYIERSADAELIASITNERFSYVLSPRATGKSSLMARAIKTLRGRGQLAAHVDLNQIGSRGDSADPVRWYYGIAYRIVRELRLKLPLQAWWQEKSALPSEQRLAEFFSEIVLANTNEPVTIFLDEIERIAGLSFSDELFGVLQGGYARRVSEPDYSRLNFVVLGAATPRGLCADPAVSPFADGRAIALEDFTREQCHALAPGFRCDEPHAIALIDRIHEWTKGQPYLTQKVSRGVVRKGGKLDDVDRVVHEQFLAAGISREEPLLSHIRSRLVQRVPGSRQALGVLAKIAKDPVPAHNVAPAARDILEVSGVASTGTDGRLRPRNRIYERVFDRSWARSALPFNWRLPIAAGAAAALAVAVPFWYLQVVPRPYIETLSAERVDVAEAEAAHRRLSRLPGFGDTADRMLIDALARHSAQAQSMEEVLAADAALRRLPDGEQAAERLLSRYWLRRARAAMHAENRDEALLFALEAMPGRGTDARQLAAELIGADYAVLERSFRVVAEPAWWEVDWAAEILTVVDPAHRVRRFSLRGDVVALPDDLGEARRIPGRLTALEHVPVPRELEVDEAGIAGAFDVELTVEHARASDLRVILTAPSGAQARLEVPESRGDGEQTLRFNAGDGSPLAALAGHPRRGAWRLTVVDHRTGEVGLLTQWGLRFAPDRRLWQDIPEQGVSLPDPRRTEQVEITLGSAGRFALARPMRAGVTGAVAVWDLVEGRLVNDLEFQTPPEHVRFSASPERVLAVSGPAATIWDIGSGAAVARFSAATQFLMPPALSPDGGYAAIVERGAEDGPPRVGLVRLSDGEVTGSVEGLPGTREVALGYEAAYVAVLTGSRVVHVVDPEEGSELAQLPHRRDVVRLLPMRDAHGLLSVDASGDIYRWTFGADGRTGGAPERYFVGTTEDPESVSLADGAAVAAFAAADGRVVTRSLTDSAVAPFRVDRSNASVRTRVAPDGARLLTVNARAFRLWRTGGGAATNVDPDLSALALDPDGEVAVTGFRSGHVRVHSAAEPARRAGRGESVDFIGHRGRITSLSVNALHNRLVSGGESGVVRVWNLADAAPTQDLLRHPEGPIHAVAVSRDGQWVASAAEYSARVWQTGDGALVGEVPVSGAALSVAFSPGNDAIVVGDSAGNIFFGAPRESEPLQSARAQGPVQAVAFSPDGRWLGSGETRGSAQVWDAETGEPVTEPRAFSHPVSWVAFDRSGETLLVRSGDWIHELDIDGRELGVRRSRLLPAGFRVDATAAPAPGRIHIAGIIDGRADFAAIEMRDPAVEPLPEDSPLFDRDWQAILGVDLDASTGLVSVR